MATQAHKTVSAINLEALGAELKKIRGDRALHVVGKEAQMDPGYLSRVEKGKQKIGEKSLVKLLDFYEITGVLREELVSYLTEDLVVAWWAKYGALVPPTFARRLALEAEACLLEELTRDTFGLMFQTEAFAREIIENEWVGVGPDDLELWLQIRGERQRRLFGSEPLRVHSLFHEDALHGSAVREIIVGQLEHLLELAELDNVTLQMVPRSSGRPGRSAAVVDRLSFSEEGAPKVVFSEGLGTHYVREPQDNQRFQRAFTKVWRLALEPGDTVAAIQDRLKEIR
ncbi:Scr1 family TA system antitoxin-like transcriptional regulator [Kitasatospora kifunensis]|uniref:Transcriptional regulator with XRE-family HTH domain n=1 Tax=Kitasatospora kifunensis TaxID=58351 RepID=A0A7W7QXG6_KITKI|nr:Scr1 family TA system antitoxin-like transcriptional regulator [Kitasatospora kifunensis]MBB4921338.1 transcriptional regulator with XRE-family HTH domain [Kitasatospora kifunensis]